MGCVFGRLRSVQRRQNGSRIADAVIRYGQAEALPCPPGVHGNVHRLWIMPDAVVQQVFQQPCQQRLIHRKHRLLCRFFLFQCDPAVLCQRAFAELRHQLPEQRPCPEVFPAQGLGTVFQLTGQVQVINEGAEQLEQDALLPDSSRQKAAGIRTQCEKLRALIDDLNLTSKLEYGAQPLRRKDLRAGPLFRQLVAQFCESPLAERCGITLEQEEQAEQTVLSVDEALLARLLENLMNNSVRHNPKPVNITVHTRRAGERFCLTVADDGIGYPAAVLAALNAAEPAENAPHILGLYVVQQIAAAHGGRAVFGQNTPHGAKAVVYLPLG